MSRIQKQVCKEEVGGESDNSKTQIDAELTCPQYSVQSRARLGRAWMVVGGLGKDGLDAFRDTSGKWANKRKEREEEGPRRTNEKAGGRSGRLCTKLDSMKKELGR